MCNKTYSRTDIINIFNIEEKQIIRCLRRGVISPNRDSRGYRIYTENDAQKIKKFSSMLTTEELAERSGCSKVQIRNWRNAGLIECEFYGREAVYDVSQIDKAIKINKSKHKTWNDIFTDEQISKIYKEYPYKGGKELAKEFGYTTPKEIRFMKNKIRKFAIENGVKLIKRDCVNHNFFDDMDDEYSCYCYGLIVTDGTVYYTFKGDEFINGSWGITLNDRDISVLETLKDSMNYLYPLQSEGSKRRHTATLGPNSTRMTKKLYDMGVIMRKSYNDISNIWIPEDRRRFGWFLRGIIDGDGSVECGYLDIRDKTYGGISICQGVYNKNLLLRLQSILKENFGILSNVHDYKSKYELNVRGIDFKKTFELIYDNPNVFIERKYNTGKYAYNNQDFSNCIDWGNCYLYFRDKLKKEGLDFYDYRNSNLKELSEEIGIKVSSLKAFLIEQGLYVPIKDNPYYINRRKNVIDYALKYAKDNKLTFPMNRDNFSIKEAEKILGYDSRRVAYVLQKEGLYEIKVH